MLLQCPGDGHRYHLREVLEMTLGLGVKQSIVLLTEVAALCDHGDLFDEQTVEDKRLLFVVLLHRFFLIFQWNRADLCE